MPSAWRQVAAALLMMVAGLVGVLVINDEPAEAAAWNCWSSGNSSGRLFMGGCQGRGGFYVKSICRDADGERPYNSSGTYAVAPHGTSQGKCKLGWHPGSTWIVAL